jgi:hypothetical protein
MSLVVKAYHPWRSKVVSALLVLVVALIGWSLYEYGRFNAGFDSFQARDEQRALVKHNGELENQIDSLQEQKAVLERNAQIKQKAYEDLDTSLKVLQGEILELKERFKVEPNGKPRGFRYKVILTQVLKEDRTARGSLQMAFEGMLNNEAKVFNLQDVSEKHIKEEDFRFRYFQNIEGDIQLPTGFKPQRVTIKVISRHRSSGNEPLEKTFDWPDRK